MPHPSAYDPEIDDHVEQPTGKTTTLDFFDLTKLRRELWAEFVERQAKGDHASERE